MPSTFVAQMLGVREFGFGSTLAFRATDFERKWADFPPSAATSRTITNWRSASPAWENEHFFRSTWSKRPWAKTPGRVFGITNSGGLVPFALQREQAYAGLPITHAGMWAVVALCFGAFRPAFALLGLRMFSALLFSRFILRHRLASSLFWLAPVWDLYAFAVWGASYFGSTVRWRDKTLEIDGEGRIRT